MLKELKPFQNWNYIIPGAFVRGCTQYWCCFCMDTRVQSCKRQMVWHSECNVQFYFPKGPPPSKDTTESCMARVNEIYGAHPEGLPAAGECTEVNPIPLRTGLSRRSSCQWGFEIVAVGANWITQSYMLLRCPVVHYAQHLQRSLRMYANCRPSYPVACLKRSMSLIQVWSQGEVFFTG